MKLIITETQFDKLVLLEQTDKPKDRNEVILFLEWLTRTYPRLAYSDLLGLNLDDNNPNSKSVINAWNYKVKVGEVEKPLKDWFYEKFYNCVLEHTKLLPEAVKFWKDWLSSPITKEKFKKNWKVGSDNKLNGKNVDEIFSNYFKLLDNIILRFYDKKTMSMDGMDFGYQHQNVFQFVVPSNPNKIFINCSQNNKQKLQTLIHETQHLLWMIQPLNPELQIKNLFTDNNTKFLTFSQMFGMENLSTNINMSSVSKKYGIPMENLILLNNLVKESEKGSMSNYICDENEKMSNIISFRSLFNIKPNQNIKQEMLLNFLKKPLSSGSDQYWFFLCWAKRGFPELQTMIDRINELAQQEYNKGKNKMPEYEPRYKQTNQKPTTDIDRTV